MKKLLTGGLLAFALMFGVANVSEQPINAAVANKTVKDKKKRVTSITKYYNNKKVKQTDGRKYQGNTKKLKTRTITNYNGKAINSKTTAYVYTYNKAGQLKTNKKGKATRTDYKYFLNNKVSAKRTCTYNAKGKIKCSKWNTKSYKKNKAVAVYKIVPATYKTITVTPAQPAKPAVTKQVWKEATKDTYYYGGYVDSNFVLMGFGPSHSWQDTYEKYVKDNGYDKNIIKNGAEFNWAMKEIYEPKGLAFIDEYDLRDYGYIGEQAAIKKCGSSMCDPSYQIALNKVGFGPGGLSEAKRAVVIANAKKAGVYEGYNTATPYMGRMTKTLVKGQPAGYQTVVVTPAQPAKPAVTKKVQTAPAKKVLVRYK